VRSLSKEIGLEAFELSETLDIVVAGGGIAGLSAGLTAARLGRRTLVLAGDMLGGHLLNIERIDGYPGFPDGVPGYDLLPMAEEQAAAAGAELVMAELATFEATDSGWRVGTADAAYAARSVILATGTRLRDLDVPGESLLRGKGVSQCASCDAPLLRQRDVVVAGGGDSALQEALTLAVHCSSVTVVHHGEDIAGQAAYKNLVRENEKISFEPDSEITAILGDTVVDGVRIENRGNGAAKELACAGVFVFVGLTPNTAFIEDHSLLDAAGKIPTDARMRTARRGLLAAGTVRAGGNARAAAAAGEGAAAALAADEFLTLSVWPPSQ
jgi:thioredoxin reductase (NADPH)